MPRSESAQIELNDNLTILSNGNSAFEKSDSGMENKIRIETPEEKEFDYSVT